MPDCVTRATVLVRASVVRPSVLPLTQGFSETAAWIQAEFYGKLPIRHISRPFFQNLHISNFYDHFLPLHGTLGELKFKS